MSLPALLGSHPPCGLPVPRQPLALTALMLRPSEVNFFRYPARDFVELLVTKMRRLPYNSAEVSTG